MLVIALRTPTLLLAALLVTGFVLAVAPAAEARELCSNAIDSWCRSAVCLHDGFCSRDLDPVCVTEPCPQPIP